MTAGAPLTAMTTTEATADVIDCAGWLTHRTRPMLLVPTLPDLPESAGRGTGVRIAMLGAVPDRAHPDLADARVRDRPGVHITPPAEQTVVATALASLLVGQGRSQVRGLLPEAQLLVAPVLTGDGELSGEQLVRGVRWAMHQGAQVLVLPIGRRRLARGVATALRSAAATGARVFVAAGNDGPDVLAFPASVAGVVAVTAHDEHGLLPECSSWADLAAPGRDVPAAGPCGLLRLRGSSPAAVLAAGAWAMGLAGRHGRRDGVDPREPRRGAGGIG